MHWLWDIGHLTLFLHKDSIMAIVNIARGGTPDFKGFMCEGQYAEFTPPYTSPHMPSTPPYDSQADAAFGQGYLNMDFPLVPNLGGTTGHQWMQNALKKIRNQNDVILTNWVPMRSYLESYFIEVVTTDPNLDGVYITPVAYRIKWDFVTQSWIEEEVTAHGDELVAAGITQLPLGTPQSGDRVYGMARLATDHTTLPPTYGHNLVTRNAQGDPIGPLDDRYGTVAIGLRVSAGTQARIETIWRSNIAVYITTKLFQFIGSGQKG
jgi:hypothetical protein